MDIVNSSSGLRGQDQDVLKMQLFYVKSISTGFPKIDLTDLVSAEERPRLAKANLTHGVFQIRINLDLSQGKG